MVEAEKTGSFLAGFSVASGVVAAAAARDALSCTVLGVSKRETGCVAEDGAVALPELGVEAGLVVGGSGWPGFDADGVFSLTVIGVSNRDGVAVLDVDAAATEVTTGGAKSRS